MKVKRQSSRFIYHFFGGISVPSNFLCTLIFLHSWTGLPSLPFTGLPALSTLSWQTSFISASAIAGPDNSKHRPDTNIIFFIILIPYNNGCGSWAGAGLPPNPVTTAGPVEIGVVPQLGVELTGPPAGAPNPELLPKPVGAGAG